MVDLMDQPSSGIDAGLAEPEHFYGKYRGLVANNQDPRHLGRIQALVPEVLGEMPTGWASPCVPYVGTQAGFYAVPELGAGVWIEFEAGDVSRPIWVGGWWGQAEVPLKPLGAPPTLPTTKLLRTITGLTVALDDLQQSILVSDAMRQNQIEISLVTATVTVKGLARVVLDAPLVQEGGTMAVHPAVRGDVLMAYLTQITTMLNAHIHPLEMAAGILPVTPAPPQPMLSPPPPTMLSTRVKVE